MTGTRSSASSGAAAWPRCISPTTSGTTARWRSRCCTPSWPPPSAPSASCARSSTTARLQHPHILPVLDSGEADGQLWYTMPYVEGESLRDRLRREGQLPVERGAPITREVARRAGLRPPAGRRAPRHQAGEHPAQPTATRWWPTSASREALEAGGGEQLTADRAWRSARRRT